LRLGVIGFLLNVVPSQGSRPGNEAIQTCVRAP
jgi:hypothetical protein